jgi:hypothetical protein
VSWNKSRPVVIEALGARARRCRKNGKHKEAVVFDQAIFDLGVLEGELLRVKAEFRKLLEEQEASQ